MKISAETHHFEIKYVENGMPFTEVIPTGIVDDTETVVRFLREKYKGINLTQISKLAY